MAFVGTRALLLGLTIGTLVLVAAGHAAAKEDATVAVRAPHRIDLPVLPALPRALPGEFSAQAGFAFIDGAGIAGVDDVAGGVNAANFVHLEDPLVCGLPCRVNSSSFGDEGTIAFCPPAGDPNMPWRWSSGVTAPGIAGCTTTAQAAWFVNTNGFVGVQSPACSSTTGNCWTPVAIPGTGAPNGQIYADWEDLDNSCSVAPNGFYVGYGGTAPNRFIIFEWFNVKNYPCASSTTTQTFEVIIFEIDNSVEVYYGTSSASTVNATGGQENNAGNAGLQFFRTPNTPQNAGIVYFDGKPPVVTNLTATCNLAGQNGWCRSTSVNVRATDNNDVGSAGRIGMGIRNRTLAVDGGAPVNYVNNTAVALTIPEGVRTVVANATDWGLNTGTLSASVKVDATPPTFTPKPNVTAEATGQNGAVVFYSAPVASDSGSGPGTVSCVPASGSQFALGQTSVSCTVSDLAGNGPVSTSFVVRVVDTTPPTVDGRSDVTAEATGQNGASVAYSAPASHDLVSGSGTSTCAPASGSVFALGSTNVTCSATDGAGNTGTNTFAVHVVDTTPPAVDVRSDVTAEATGPGGANVAFTAPESHDLVSGDGTSSCSPASGSAFALGSTLVTCSATDAAGNTGSSTFRVRVVDTTPPTIDAHGNELAEATGPQGASVAYTPPATHDLVDGEGVATCAPASGSTFALGDTTVTCNAADARGNEASPKTFLVRVRDTTPPTIAARADVEVEASGLSGALAYYTAPATSDLVDGAGVATCAPASGSHFPVGESTVTCHAADAAGNAATPTQFKVRVTLGIRVDVRMDRSFYDARDALQGGVGGTVKVTTTDGTPVAGVEVRIRVARLVPVVGVLDNATLTETTDAAGEVRFGFPIQFALAGDYAVVAESVVPGLEGSDEANYSVGIASAARLAVFDRRSFV